MTDQTVNILNAALKLYTAKPPYEVSLSDIAREAGVSKSLVLYHFGNKQNLIRATLLHTIRSLLDELSFESVEELVDFWIKYMRERRKLTEFMLYALNFQSEDLKRDINKMFEESLDRILPLFKECKYPRETALALSAMLDGLTIYSVYSDIGSLERYREMALKFFKRCKE
ncbi:TetR/AcrR family transcriptional regulator [Archaeoglobus sp.]